jgi:hypothetical protein
LQGIKSEQIWIMFNLYNVLYLSLTTRCNLCCQIAQVGG